jgi:hypothetical protein
VRAPNIAAHGQRQVVPATFAPSPLDRAWNQASLDQRIAFIRATYEAIINIAERALAEPAYERLVRASCTGDR